MVYTIKFYIQFLCVPGYLKHSNDTPNLNIHKYTNYNIIEIYINRLSTTTQIFIAMDYFIMMSEKSPLFLKKKKAFGRNIFAHPIEVTGSMYFGKYFWSYVFTKDIYKNLKETGIIQDVSKFIIYVNL